MTPRLYKAAEVCELTGLQPYVLRSWEKEFPGIGVLRPHDGSRVYRQSDIDQVTRIKQLVFSEGLTLAGARRRLEESAPVPAREQEMAEVLDALGTDARARIAAVRTGLRSLLEALSTAPVGGGGDVPRRHVEGPSRAHRASSSTSNRSGSPRGAAPRKAARSAKRKRASA